MSKPKNAYFYHKDPAVVQRVREEYEMIGRHVRAVEGGIAILALPPKKVKKKVEEKPRRRKNEDEDAKPVAKTREQKPKAR
jgi:hypothetical protein